MSAAGKKMLEEILSKPIEHMILSKKMPPNKEALKLYREILKFSNYFYWNNTKGENWGEIIRKSARREFEIGKSESDPLIAMKMIMTTRESLQKTKEKMNDAYFKLHQTVDETRNN
ncbi:complex 1 protein, LYR family protein (macronuclear) [Tetrahymena thermophila SB210]|uniref:Complex 1 protein, LYR family protein n=1 Tax=Tetrahymena thermophila (strain SB210) TaxID=312017 RepID=Q239M5_TETTS|nr:complex 1 protein, LYR family protein [Tetrahymena thermophila SB210]EAR93245.1 complex 1 protein, LYR family protein [Tetrahymena thermophila SB210]|eukprot:XP_001013490.1 complex 1 protein, LYR family protein [Tetrahymena thermophila SB210]